MGKLPGTITQTSVASLEVDAPPPPYHPDSVQTQPQSITHAPTAPPSRDQAAAATLARWPAVPPALDAYYQKNVLKPSSWTTFHLGTSEDHRLFRVAIHVGRDREARGTKQRIALLVQGGDSTGENGAHAHREDENDGAADGDDVAAVGTEGGWRVLAEAGDDIDSMRPLTSTITLLAPGGGAGSSTETMVAGLSSGPSQHDGPDGDSGDGHESQDDAALPEFRFRFEVPGASGVGAGQVSAYDQQTTAAGSHTETFVWRACAGDVERDGNLAGLIEGPWKLGYTLVRLRTERGPATESARRTTTTITSDGHEVVAVLAWNKGWSIANRLNPFRVQFLGAGLRGELGARWSVMALITALRLWYLKNQFRASKSHIAAKELRRGKPVEDS